MDYPPSRNDYNLNSKNFKIAIFTERKGKVLHPLLLSLQKGLGTLTVRDSMSKQTIRGEHHVGDSLRVATE
eukprot:3065785-Amphidinium_carterae.1